MKNTDLNSFINLDFHVQNIIIVAEKICPLSWNYKPKDPRSNHSIVYVLDGRAKYTILHSDLNSSNMSINDGDNNDEFEVQKGNIQFFPKGSHYKILGDATQNFHFLVVNFEFDSETDINLLPIQNSYKPIHSHLLESLFTELLNIWFRKSILYKAKCTSILQNIICSIFEDAFEAKMHTSKLPKIQSALEYMDEVYNKPLKISK